MAEAQLASIPRFVAQPGSWRILGDLLGLAVAGGLFCVPLYAVLQHESEPPHRARVIAANNIINSVAMTIAAAVSAILLARGVTPANSSPSADWRRFRWRS